MGESPRTDEHRIDGAEPLGGRALGEPQIARGRLGGSERGVGVTGLSGIGQRGAEREVTRVARREAEPFIDEHLAGVGTAQAVHRARDVVAWPKGIVERADVVGLRGFIFHHAQDKFLISKREREAGVFGRTGGRAEGPAVNIGDGGRRAEVFRFVVREAHVHAEGQTLFDEIGRVADDAPAHRLVFSVNIGRGRINPRGGVRINLVGRRDADRCARIVEREFILPPTDEADEFAVEKITLPDGGVTLGFVERTRGVGVKFIEAAIRADDGDGGIGHPDVGAIIEEQGGAARLRNVRRREALDAGTRRRRAIGHRGPEVVDRSVIRIGQCRGVVGVDVEIGRVRVALVTAEKTGALEVAVNAGDGVFTEVAEEAGFLREIKRGVRGRAKSFAAVFAEIVADGIRGKIRPAEIGVGGAVDELALHIDVDRRGVEADDAGVGLVLFLFVVGDLEAERVFEKRLAEARVEGIEIRGFALVRAVEERVVKIENRRVADFLVFPEAGVGLASGRELLVEEKQRVVALRGVVADAEPLRERITAAAEHERRRAGAAHDGGVGISEHPANLSKPTSRRAEMRGEQRIGGDGRGLASVDRDFIQDVEPNRESILRRRGSRAIGGDVAVFVADVELRETIAE